METCQFCRGIVRYQNGVIFSNFIRCTIESVKEDNTFKIISGKEGNYGKCDSSDDGLDPVFHFPCSLSLLEDSLYIVDMSFHRIRKLDLKTGEASTIFLDMDVYFSYICVSDLGIFVIVNLRIKRIRKIDNVWIMEEFAGDNRKGYRNGKALESSFESPTSLVYLNNMILVSDQESHVIRKIVDDKVTTLTEDVTSPQDMCLTDYGTLLVLENHGKIKEVTIDGDVRVFDDYEDEEMEFRTICISDNYIYRSHSKGIVRNPLPKLIKSAN